MRILLAVSNADMSATLFAAMRSELMAVNVAATLKDAGHFLKSHPYDCVVASEKFGALPLLRKMRANKDDTPFMMIGGADMADHIFALMTGADDYLETPVHTGLFVARLKAVIRRARNFATSLITVGPLTLDIDANCAFVKGQAAALTNKEFTILALLVMRRNSTVSKEMILDHLYCGRDEPQLKIIDVFLCKLRAKLAHALGGQIRIDTVWGRGYRFVEAATDADRLNMTIEEAVA